MATITPPFAFFNGFCWAFRQHMQHKYIYALTTPNEQKLVELLNYVEYLHDYALLQESGERLLTYANVLLKSEHVKFAQRDLFWLAQNAEYVRYAVVELGKLVKASQI